MISRRSLIAFAFAATTLSVPAAFADDAVRPFTSAEFAAAQKAGKPILVEIHAGWCPTCRAQAPIISELRKQERFRKVVVMRVDFDSQKDAVKQFGARSQSTLIAFKGNAEAGRSVGDTSKTGIESLLAKAL